jgi:hypothetical protein
MTPRYQEFAVDAALAAHVDRLWSFEASEDGDEQAIPPDGRAEVIVHRGAPYQERGGDGRWQTHHPQMARDFRRLLGRAPSDWAKRRGGIATSLVEGAG